MRCIDVVGGRQRQRQWLLQLGEEHQTDKSGGQGVHDVVRPPRSQPIIEACSWHLACAMW